MIKDNKIKIISKALLTLAMMMFASHIVICQDINKEVTVVKAYKPEVKDATKINQMPEFNDTLAVVPNFEYSISSVRLNTPFAPRPVSAAKMLADPLTSLHTSYLKLGYGNYFTPLAELDISSQRMKENSFEIFLKHQSADGKVILDNGNEIVAPYANNTATIWGKHILKKSILYGSAGYFSNKTAFYGYNTSNQNIDISNINTGDSLQTYQGGSFTLGLESLETDSTKLYYNLKSCFDFVGDKFSHSENHLSLAGLTGKQTGEFYFGTEAYYDYYSSANAIDSGYNTIFKIRPYLSKSKGNWRFLLGFDGVNDNTLSGSTFHNYLRANLEFIVVPSVLYTFFGYDGFLEKNSLLSVSQINPYIIPGLNVKNADHKTHIFGGLKGNFSSDVQIMAQASYSEVNNQSFYINDTISKLANKFLVLYDNIELLKFSAELDFRSSKNIIITAKADYSIYSMTKLPEPWQMPGFESTISARYSLRDKIILTADLYVLGSRYARNPLTGGVIKLNPFADFNLGAEYRYTKILSLFIQFKNLTATKYVFWNQYPLYGFQVMGGFTYAL